MFISIEVHRINRENNCYICIGTLYYRNRTLLENQEIENLSFKKQKTLLERQETENLTFRKMDFNDGYLVDATANLNANLYLISSSVPIVSGIPSQTYNN